MNRINYLDTTKGIGMLIVIWNHTCSQYVINNEFIKGTNIFFASFWMPLFFITSGVFLNNNKDKFNVFITKRLKSIIVPLLIFYLLSFFLSYLAANFLSVKLNNSFEWSNVFALVLTKAFSNGALWFLSALFFSHIMYFFIQKYSFNKYIKFFFILIISSLGYSWSYFFDFRLPFYIDTAMTALLFLYLGSVILKLSEIPKSFLIQILLIIGIGIIVWLMKGYGSSMVSNYNNPLFFIPYYLVGFFGTFWVILISQSILKMKLLTYFGEFSIVILCTHYLFITPFKMIFNRIFDNNIIQVIFIFLSIIIIMYPTVYIVNKYLPFIIGKTNLKKT